MSRHHRVEQLERHLTSKFEFKGPSAELDEYRKRGVQIDKEKLNIQYYNELGPYIQSIIKPAVSLRPSNLNDLEIPLDEYRRRDAKFMFDYFKAINLNYEDFEDDLYKQISVLTGLIVSGGQGTGVRGLVHLFLYLDSIRFLGTEKHKRFIINGMNVSEYGCFGMTELGHGSNVASVETIAVYDPQTSEFVIDSPTPTSAKVWIGAMANIADMSVIFAQLIIGQKNHGVHAFLIRIRDRQTHNMIPGIIIGDMGEKMGAHQIDNGFCLFKGYRTGYDSMLDKFSHITADGKFKSNIKSNEKRFAAMLVGLARGRASVIGNSCENMLNGLTIAIRYGAVRKQFSPTGDKEVPILDYPLHRYRLMPHLARMFAVRSAFGQLYTNYVNIRHLLQENPECEEGAEFHAILSCYKPIASWVANACLQECREACGGHGYSAFSMISRIRETHDVHTTWEGDNNVLIQQTARYILKQFQQTMKGKSISSPSLQFLMLDSNEVFEKKATFGSQDEMTNSEILLCLEMRVNIMLHQTIQILQEAAMSMTHVMDAWNNSMVFGLKDLSIAYGELQFARDFKQAFATEAINAQFLNSVWRLYALDVIEKAANTLVGQYLNWKQMKIIRGEITSLCNVIGESAVNIVDAIQIGNSLDSALGQEDGQVYQNYTRAVEAANGVYETPKWIKILKDHQKTVNQNTIQLY